MRKVVVPTLSAWATLCAAEQQSQHAVSSDPSPTKPPTWPPQVAPVMPTMFTANVKGFLGNVTEHGTWNYDWPRNRLRNDYVVTDHGQTYNMTQLWLADQDKFFVFFGDDCSYSSLGIGLLRPDPFENALKTDPYDPKTNPGGGRYVGREMQDGRWSDHFAYILGGDQFNIWQDIETNLPLYDYGPGGGGDLAGNHWLSWQIGKVPESAFALDTSKCKKDDSALKHMRIPSAFMRSAETLVAAPKTPERKASTSDLKRARHRIPRAGWKGDSFAHMSELLTAKLSGLGHQVRQCKDWRVAELEELQRRLFQESDQELLDIYSQAQDNRRLRFHTLSTLEAHWQKLRAASAGSRPLIEMRRDGLCHEAVMWAVHHLTAERLAHLKLQGLVLPSLPVAQHGAPHASAAHEHHTVHAEYQQQVSCQQCHTGALFPLNATIPGSKDVPVDKKHPGRERVQRCTYKMDPPCGPCEGLGGKRWGDDPEEFTPMKCEVIHGPETPPTTHGCYPKLATAQLTGDTRQPMVVFPDGKPGKYPPINGTITMGDTDDALRLRYDFNYFGSEIAIQTMDNVKQNDPGVMVLQGNVPQMLGDAAAAPCSCIKSIVGNFHACSFEANETLDHINLPGKDGGAAYLGRVRVTLDGDVPESQREATADHYLKWAFHFLVDADEGSPTFGLPLRLYGAGGRRMVFHNWKVGDPSIARPDVWHMPQGCNATVPQCSVFPKAAWTETASENLVV